jgi:drug/metabolite transporter (DMT)-like permease
MTQVWYWLGVALAIVSGLFNNYGTVLQKKAVNEIPEGERLLHRAIRSPVWLVGLAMQFVLGTAAFMAAELYIGPALIPGLMALGLILLAFSSVRMNRERLGTGEYGGIALMIAAIAALGWSGLSIDLPGTDLLDKGFLIRSALFSAVLFIAILACEAIQRAYERTRGIALSVLSGLMFSLANFWIAPLMGVAAQAAGGAAGLRHWILFGFSSAVLIATNVVGITSLQTAYRYGQASNLIPIQQVPIQLTPVLVYFLVFSKIPAGFGPLILMAAGILGIVASSFLLGKRQAGWREETAS